MSGDIETNPGPLRIYYQNVNGLKTKIDEFSTNIILNSYEIICLTETNLNTEINSQELFINNNYIVYRNDRNLELSSKRSGGGVLCAVKTEFESFRRYDLNSTIEALWIQCKVEKDIFLVCTVYFPPKSKFIDFEYFSKYLDNIINTLDLNTHVIIVGDFNLPTIEWEVENNISIPNQWSGAQAEEILLVTAANDFSQVNIIKNYYGKILDLVFSNKENISVEKCDDPVVLEDKYHPSLVILITGIKQYKSFKEKYTSAYNYKKADYDKLNELLKHTPWSLLDQIDNVNEMIDIFYDLLHAAINDCVPIKKISKKRKNYPTWFSNNLINVLERKLRAHKTYKRFPSRRNYANFSVLRSLTKSLYKQDHRKYIELVENNIQDNPKLFWSYIHNKNKNHGIPTLMSYEQVSSSNQKEICDLFASFFKSVYSVKSPRQMRVSENVYYHNNSLGQITINSSDTMKLMNSLDPNKAFGHDRIPPILIKKCSESLADPLTKIYNKSITTGTFPKVWKKSIISPIFKSGDRSLIINYRPISLLCIFGKVFESLVYSKIFPSIQPYISDAQHGFFPNRSTTSNLICFFNNITKAIEDHAQFDVLYTDFRKAFDTVDQNILLKKMEDLGFYGPLLSWCESYLTDREQQVVLNGNESYTFNATSGVPQGSHLGPLFFLIFINDLPFEYRYSLSLFFADDQKMGKIVSSEHDSILFQKDIEVLYEWCEKNNLRLNFDKCFIISFGLSRNMLIYDYKLSGKSIKRVTQVNDLGIIFDSNLSFKNHIISIARKASRNLGFLKRSCSVFTSENALKTVYFHMVRSTMEYNSIIWNFLGHPTILEKIQKRFIN